MKKNPGHISKIFSALSSESRLGILLYIYDKQRRTKGRALRCQNGACIKDLAKSLSVTVPTASHHIKELVNAGLVITERKGKWVYCEINQKAFEDAVSFLSQWAAKT